MTLLLVGWFETRSYYVALTGLELCINQASSKITDIFLPLGLNISTTILDPRDYNFVLCVFCTHLMILKSRS